MAAMSYASAASSWVPSHKPSLKYKIAYKYKHNLDLVKIYMILQSAYIIL